MLNQFNASLWGDEAWAVTLAVKPLWEIIKIVSRDTSPPLYYLLDHLWMSVFGTSEVSIRTLTFIFFLATVFFVYLIGRHLWDERTALLAALLTLGNYFLFKAGFEGRMYALLALTTTASMYFFLKKQKWPYVLAATAALYTHHFAIFAIFTQALWRLKESRGQIRKKFTAVFGDFFLIAILYLPWLYPLYYQTSLVGSGFWLAKPTLRSIGEILANFLIGPRPTWIKIATPLLLFLILLWRDWKKARGKTAFLLAWFLLPILLTFLASQVFQSIFFDRYLLFVIPGGLLVLASNPKKSSLGFLIAFMALMLIGNYHYFTHPTKRPFRDFAFLVKQKIKNHDFLINYGGGAHHLFESKYYGLKAPLYVPEGELPFYIGTALMEEEDVIKEIPEETIRLGVITSGSLQEIKIPGFQLLTAFEVGELKFARFVPNETSPGGVSFQFLEGKIRLSQKGASFQRLP